MNNKALIISALILGVSVVLIYFLTSGKDTNKQTKDSNLKVYSEENIVGIKPENNKALNKAESVDFIDEDEKNQNLGDHNKEADSGKKKPSERLFTADKALDIDVINKLFEDRSKFDEMQNQFSELYPDSEEAFENKIKYQELFLSTKEQYSSEVNLNRIECNSEQCLASIYVNSLNEVKDYVGNLRRSENHPMNSLIVGQENDELLLVFTTTQDSGLISLSKDQNGKN